MTGIHSAVLEDAPSLGEVLERLLDTVGGRPIVAHNGFGYDFLVPDAAIAASRLTPPPGSRLDSLELAHIVFPRAGDLPRSSLGEVPPATRSLDDLAGHLGVEVPGRAHRAARDAEMYFRLTERMVAMLAAA